MSLPTNIEPNQEQPLNNTSLPKIREMVKSGKYTLKVRLREKVSENSRVSRAWNTFYNVVDDNGIVLEDFVCCIYCKKTYIYVTSSGTKKFLNHQDACLRSLLSAKLNADESNKNSTENRYLNDLNAADKLLMTAACSDLIIRDLRPLNALNGEGLNALLKTYAYICLKYNGLQNEPNSYLPSTDTVARNVLKQFKEIQTKLKPMLKDVFSENGSGGGICLDIWTDRVRKISYLGVTVHYVDANFVLHSRVIDNKPLPSEQSKTGQFLHDQMKSILNEYDIDIESKLITFVTDRGSNIVKALEKYTRHNDGPHFFHNTVQKVFLIGTPKEILKCCKELVTHIKHAGLNDLFSPSLKTFIETRWNSVLELLESILANWDKLIELLVERNESHYLANILPDDLKEMIKFLTPFREATLQMESSKKVTLFWCCIFNNILEKHLVITSDDSELIIEMKNNCTQYYLETLVQDRMIQVRHLLAIFLHPSLKSLNKMTVIERRQVHQEVNICTKLDICQHLKSNIKTNVIQCILILLQVINQLKAHSQKTIDEKERTLIERQSEVQPDFTSSASNFLMLYDNEINLPDVNVRAQIELNNNQSAVKIIEDEIERYKILESPGINCDLLQWWQKHEETLPLLSKLARAILAIPASSAATESNFSTAGYVVSPLRSQLNTSLVRSILVCRSNKDLL